VALGSSFHPGSPPSRPALYASLKVGDKVISPFTISCGECQYAYFDTPLHAILIICACRRLRYCRLGFTARCVSSLLFGSPALQGAQAQYVRVPLAGGTLFSLSTPSTSVDDPLSLSQELSHLPDPTALLLADVLPTGLFVMLQALTHPKLAPIFTGIPWPRNAGQPAWGTPLSGSTLPYLSSADRVLDVGIIGLGPVGLVSHFNYLISKQ